MDKLLSIITVRKVAILGMSLILFGGALALMMDADRKRAVVAATEHGNKLNFQGEMRVVTLNSRNAVDDVLPLLKDLPELRELQIARVPLTPEDLVTIGELRSLVVLRLADCGLTGDETLPLGNLTNVASLNLLKNPLTDRGMRFMNSMKSLQRVDLTGTRIRGEGLRYLASLPQLRELWLSYTLIDDHTIGYCAELKQLQQLHVNQTDVSANGLAKLTDLHWLEGIAVPDRISWDDRERLGDAFIASRRQTRAAGEAVPTHDNSPFGRNPYRTN